MKLNRWTFLLILLGLAVVISVLHAATGDIWSVPGFRIKSDHGVQIGSSGPCVYTGSANTRAKVVTQVGTSGGKGSLYLSTAGVAYLKVYEAVGADTQWEKVTTSAAD